jgi:hypothetical protein
MSISYTNIERDFRLYNSDEEKQAWNEQWGRGQWGLRRRYWGIAKGLEALFDPFHLTVPNYPMPTPVMSRMAERMINTTEVVQPMMFCNRLLV